MGVEDGHGDEFWDAGCGRGRYVLHCGDSADLWEEDANLEWEVAF